MRAKLTGKQAAFVREYLVDMNATQAAIRAGYSPKTARVIATQNLTKAAVSEEIARAMQERTERTQIDADYVLRQAVKLHERCMRGGKGFDAGNAARSLDLIGKHVNVQAFLERRDLSSKDGSMTPQPVTHIERVILKPKA